MADVGRLAGVSQVTVSRALSNPKKVSPETLARIHAAIEQTNYVPNALAGALASRKSGLITALVPSITNIVYSSLLHTFSEIMRAEGYQIMLSETGFDPAEEEALIRTHLARRPDGVLLTGITHTAAARKMLLGAAVPVVEIWDITESPIECCAGFSHPAAGQAVAEFAHQAGYARAATVSAGDARAKRRRAAFEARFASLTGNSVSRIEFPEGPATLERGRSALRELAQTADFQSGVIFCSSDQYALGVMIEARAMGLRIPDDIAVVGFGDQEFAAHTDPPLTTVRINRAALGGAAASALLARFRGEETPERIIDVGFDIVRRASA